MPPRPTPATTPAALLRQARPLKALFDQAQRIDRLQHLLDNQLPPAARDHCRVASFREGTLVLVVGDGNWATRLRYQQRRLQQGLSRLPEFAGLARIAFKVRPDASVPAPSRPVPELSEAAACSLRAAAEGIADPRLREALERLAANAGRGGARG